MNKETGMESWELLARIVETGDATLIESYLDGLSPNETARAISRISPEDQNRLFALLDPEEAAGVLREIPDAQAADVMEELPADTAAAILSAARSDDQADLVAELGDEEAEAIIDRMAPARAAGLRKLLTYPPDTAGGIMITEFLAYRDSLLGRDLVDDLETHRDEYADISVQYMYVVDKDEKLKGVLRMRDLVFPPKTKPISETMITDPMSVEVDQTLHELELFFERHALLGVPVVDSNGCLLGVVRRSDVEEAVAKRSQRQFLSFSGIVGGEEFRSMPLLSRAGRRLSWLSINIVLNIIAASVIAMYQDTLAAVIALAVFLPMISDMSGCSGNQAVAVSMRELSIGLVRPNEVLRVFGKEIAVGILNGIVLGALLGGVAILWKGNAYLGLVVGVALAANTIVAVSLGGLLPLVLKRMKLDPALVSGPVLTTVTDMCGFFIVLSLATVLLGRLTG